MTKQYRGADRWARSAWRALALAGFLCSAPAQARNVGLIVTVGHFQDKDITVLNGTQADGEAVRGRLIKDWHFAPEDIRFLRDEDATRARVLNELDALPSRSAPGDTVVIYYSGHGTSASDNLNPFDLPYDTGAWIPYDVVTTSNDAIRKSLIVGRTDLLPRLKRLDEGGRFVLVLTDSCYSGQLVRSLKPRAVTRNYTPTRSVASTATAPQRPPPPPYPYQHVLMLSAASDSEAAEDISCPPSAPGCAALKVHPTVDSRFHGAFTDALLRLMDGQLTQNRSFSYAAAQTTLASYMGTRGFSQTPQILPSVKEDAANLAARGFLGDTGDLPQAVAAEGALRVRFDGASPALRTRVAALAGIAIVEGDSDLVVAAAHDGLALTTPAGDPVIPAPADEADVIRRVGAEAWLRAHLPEKRGKLGLRAETDPGSRGGTFLRGETFNFQLKLEQQAYVMVLDLDAQGRLNLLYPLRQSEAKAILPAQAQAIPGNRPQDRILVAPPFGTDLVSVIALPEKPDLPDSALGSALFETTSSRATTLMQAIGSQAAAEVLRLSIRTYPKAVQ